MPTTSINTHGPIFAPLSRKMAYSPDLMQIVESTVRELHNQETSAERPGMLLGKVQSGKTRAFIATIGLAFDNGFDIAVILTKGTVALANQTVMRLQQDFAEARAADEVAIFDILKIPAKFNAWQAKRKLIVVCKKQKVNLAKLHTLLTEDRYQLAGRRVLIIDDEADYASIGFRRKPDQLEMAKIASEIDSIRKQLKAPAFLQVTATPYSLYLQPEVIELDGLKFERMRPAFTKLVPVHSRYIGSDFFFDDEHPQHSIAHHCFVPIEDEEELSALKKEDGRRVKKDTVLTSKAVATLRAAIVTFIVGGCSRRLIAQSLGEKPSKYSFIVHTETATPSHGWQEKLVGWVVEALKAAPANDPNVLSLVKSAWENLGVSVEAGNTEMPPLEKIWEIFPALTEALSVEVVNSEKKVADLLDENGQLRLESPLNIFVGGQILDRGITIANLIGFFYGRNPKRFQQDTVLQHARLFGARPIEDLLVTRFYTTHRIHAVLQRIHEIDTALREAFEKGGHEHGVVFIERDVKNRVVLCSPNKIMVSNTVTLRPHRRLLPVGFQTRTPKRNIEASLAELDQEIDKLTGTDTLRDPLLVPVKQVLTWIDLIASMLDFEPGYEFDWLTFKASIEYLASRAEQKGKIYILVRTGRDVKRERVEGGIKRFTNAPDTAQREGKIARDLSSGHTPVLMLLRQEGTSDGWLGCPFWWPVLMTPGKMKPVIFSTESDLSDSDKPDEDV